MQRLKGLVLCCCDSSQPEQENTKIDIARSIIKDSSSAGLLEPQGLSGKQKSESSKVSEKSEIPELDLEVIESSILEAGRVFKIKPDGITGMEVTPIDGSFRFGTTNDGRHITLPQEDGMGGSHFSITYNASEAVYFLQDLGEGTGTFMRIDRKLRLMSRYILSFGDTHMGVFVNQLPTSSSVNLRILDGPMSDQQFDFDQNEVVKIGRTQECQIKFDSTNMSRVQCIVAYSVELGWFIQDGDGNRGSTNGTWLYIDEPFQLIENTVFKAGQTLFLAKPPGPQLGLIL